MSYKQTPQQQYDTDKQMEFDFDTMGDPNQGTMLEQQFGIAPEGSGLAKSSPSPTPERPDKSSVSKPASEENPPHFV